MIKDYGKIAITIGGAWSASTAYEKLTAVTRNGQSYLSIIDNTGVDPAIDVNPTTGVGTHWLLIARKGDPGSDATVTAQNIAAALGYVPVAPSDVPDELADLAEDSQHRSVTDTEKTAWNAKYDKPAGGVPKSDMASGVQSSLDSADSAYQKPNDGIPETDLALEVQESLGAADSAYQKPSSGVPKTDLASGVQESLDKADASASQNDLDAINAKIPSQASAQNQLADKAFVNSTVETATATPRGTYNLVTDLSLTISATEQQIATALGSAISVADKNDYAFVQIPTSNETPTQIARVDRYKHNGTNWLFEYSLNNSGYTAAQWAAINSGITDVLVEAFRAKYDKPGSGIPKTDLASVVQTSLDKADASYSKPSTGIPKSDMAADVQSSLNKADSALQQHQDISGKEDKSNKTSSWGQTPSNDKYPTEKLVYDTFNPSVVTVQPQDGFLPNVVYDIGAIAGEVEFSLAAGENGKVNHYLWAFDTGVTAPTITWPSGISWVGSAPDVIANKHYEVSIMDGTGVWMEA